MSNKTSALPLLCLLSISVVTYGGEIYKWTDQNGQIHYGDSTAGSQNPNATTIDWPNATITGEQRQEADARLKREQTQLKQNVAPDESQAPSQGASGATPTGAEHNSCEAQWKKYEDSYACFDPYRLANGGVKTEAFEHCTEEKMPDCPRPQYRP